MSGYGRTRHDEDGDMGFWILMMAVLGLLAIIGLGLIIKGAPDYQCDDYVAVKSVQPVPAHQNRISYYLELEDSRAIEYKPWERHEFNDTPVVGKEICVTEEAYYRD